MFAWSARRWHGLALLAAFSVACGRPPATPTDDDWSLESSPSHPLLGYRAAFVLTWRGARMGSAVEELRRHPTADDQLQFIRRERIVVRRGEQLVPHETSIAIDADGALRALAVKVRRSAGATVTEGRAQRAPDGSWRVWFGDEPVQELDGDAVPAELLGLLIAGAPGRDFRGTALLPGYGFAVADVEIAPRDGDPRSVTATVETPLGAIASQVELAADGTVRAVHGSDGVGAIRVDPGQLEEPFDPPELVDSASIAIEGRVPARGRFGLALDRLDERDRPPDLPGQELVIETPTSWHLVIGRGDHGSPAVADPPLPPRAPRFAALAETIVARAGSRSTADEVTALALATADLLDDDLSTAAATADAALALGRGDCTAHASLFRALAAARGIPTRLVTGFRIDRGRLVRHRWAIARVGDRWVAIDPTYGEAPARPRLIGLAVHGGTAAELAVVDTLAFTGLDHARARVIEWRD